MKFEDTDWEEMAADAAAAARGRIGRVFEVRGWISNLDVDENITLAQRHHTSRPLGEIEAEALALAQQFGLADLPRLRPAMLRAGELRRAAWIRALLGAPTLILLEHPRARGGGVVDCGEFPRLGKSARAVFQGLEVGGRAADRRQGVNHEQTVQIPLRQ